MSATTYMRSQKILHWLIAALLLFGLFVGGELLEDAEGADKAFVAIFHSSFGVTILALMLWRFSLRRRHPVAPMDALKPWEKTWSRIAHLTLYGLVILMAVSGVMQGMFADFDIRLFGLLNISQLQGEAGEVFHVIHHYTADALKIVIAVHILAALKHQFLDKLPMLRRMS